MYRRSNSIEVLKGKHLNVTRTIDWVHGEIIDQFMSRPGLTPVKVQSWTCLNLEDNILRDGLFPGISVCVEGLLKAVVYNGQKDVVIKMMDDNRVVIKLSQPPGPPKELSVKRENLFCPTLKTHSLN
jgi:hypothetical protein